MTSGIVGRREVARRPSGTLLDYRTTGEVQGKAPLGKT
jgi:hypothetical protein